MEKRARKFAVLCLGLVLCLGFVGVAGCTLGLTPEQKQAVQQYQQKAGELRSELDKTVALIVEFRAKIADASKRGPGETLEVLLGGLEAALAHKADLTRAIGECEQSVKVMRDKGVPGWSIALNVAETVAVTLFGGGTISGLIYGLLKARASTAKYAEGFKILSNTVDQVLDNKQKEEVILPQLAEAEILNRGMLSEMHAEAKRP